MIYRSSLFGLIGAALIASPALAGGHAKLGVVASDQDVSSGVVAADKVMANANGWMVVHRTDASKKPGPVVGHAPLRKGENTDVVAILKEPVQSGDMLMLMVHGEAGGKRDGIFEYSLGATADGPVRMDGKLVMTVIQAK